MMKKSVFCFSTLREDILYFRKMFSIRSIIIVLIISSLFGCKKDSPILKGVDRVVEGNVFEDCNGNVSQGNKIYLQYSWIGRFGGGVISKDSTVTDGYGHFIFHYTEYEHEQSTTSFFYALTIPNSSINLSNPSGNYDLYPNETTMNAVIHLKFHNIYTSSDTFYFQFKPTYDGFIHDPQLTQFFVGPFHDTTLVLNNLTVGNSNGNDNRKSYSGIFKWGIGQNSLHSNYTGHDGYFDLTHQPCALTDTFEYYAHPI